MPHCSPREFAAAIPKNIRNFRYVFVDVNFYKIQRIRGGEEEKRRGVEWRWREGWKRGIEENFRLAERFQIHFFSLVV